MYMFGSRWLRRRRGELMRGLGLGFTNPVETGGVLEVCLCLDCGGICGEWVGGLEQGLEEWVVLYLCEL